MARFVLETLGDGAGVSRRAVAGQELAKVAGRIRYQTGL